MDIVCGRGCRCSELVKARETVRFDLFQQQATGIRVRRAGRKRRQLRRLLEDGVNQVFAMRRTDGRRPRGSAFLAVPFKCATRLLVRQ